jgi:hypothetical protein
VKEIKNLGDVNAWKRPNIFLPIQSTSTLVSFRNVTYTLAILRTMFLLKSIK